MSRPQKHLFVVLAIVCFPLAWAWGQTEIGNLKIVDRIVSSNQPALHNAVYAERTGSRLLGSGQASDDNGRSWSPSPATPDFTANLPYGYRRDPMTSVLDAPMGRLLTIINALDTPGLDPASHEPALAQQNYYLRYRVSSDGGRAWLFDEPIVQHGAFDAKHPAQDIWIGTNAIYLGDIGSIPLVTRAGKILVPTQTTLAGPGGKLDNPGGGFTYTDVLVLIGTWTKDARLQWDVSQRVSGDSARTTRGLLEPTLAELPDGRILMVMRGSNGGKADPHWRLPSHKWFSVSRDGGQSWSKPEPWTYDDGTPFFSPSSMSALFVHSSGRSFWVGNISATNCNGNLPRWPLVVGEVDGKSLRLVRDSVLTVDTHQLADDAQGRLDISHVSLLEDRETGEIVLSYPRAHNSYKSREWVTVRLALPKGEKLKSSPPER